MGSHEQYRRSPHARRPYYGHPDVDDSERSWNLHASSHDFAPQDNIADQPLQSYNPQHSYQPALSSMDPGILGQYQPHMWPHPEGSPQQGQSWDERYPNSAIVQDASNYQINAFGAPGDWHADQRYPLEQGGASVLTVNNHSENRNISSNAFTSLAGSSAQNSDHLQQAKAVVDGQTFQNTILSSYSSCGTVHHNPHPLGPRQSDTTLSNADLQQEPWSFYHPVDVCYEPVFLEGAPGPDLQETPYMALSTTDYVSENMENSVVTERPGANYPQYADADQIPPYNLPYYTRPIQIDIERSATPFETPSTTQGSSQWDLGLDIPMQRSHSTRSSLSNASSSGPPPTHTPEVMYCEVVDCKQSFTGLYSRGNLGRHRRLVHGTGSRYVCGDDTCAKEFRRQDARLKHYRKYHPELAADSPLVRRSSASRPTRRHQEVELSNMSGWAT
ncbi:hypothetical protein BKA58DRAFT_443834 [Alternaria rosae]|uniref:uncharacterized protein n=1 Tax=Alternaria rosae TaxID=1187941 RepID=UPI001E8ECEF9|nr:uncharacterized protein BKA58DRAFT_443834 [Alternaria rosae]KAH6861064.1 hypothetical protein BKA58DRAFT_443834 [Alternaria rosae]